MSPRSCHSEAQSLCDAQSAEQDYSALLPSHKSSSHRAPVDVDHALSVSDVVAVRDCSDSDESRGTSTMALSGGRRKAKYSELNQLYS